MRKNKNEKFECIACGCEEYEIKNYGATLKEEDGTIIGRYPFYVAECKECGQPVFMDYLDRENKRVEAEFMRKHFDLLSVEEIRKLPRRYNVSREVYDRALARAEQLS